MFALRILQIITSGEIGGAQTVLVDLVKGICRDYDVEVDVLVGEGEYLPRALSGLSKVNIIGSPYLTRSINPLKDIKALLEMLSLLKLNQYDLVHCHSSKASWLGRIAGTMSGVKKIIMTVHGLSFFSTDSWIIKQAYSVMEKIAMTMASEYVFVSSYDMQLMKNLGIKESKCSLIYNGRPIPSNPKVGLRELLPISGSAPIVCMVARLAEIKDPISFIRIAARVLKMYGNDDELPVFIIVGGGQMYDECIETILKLGVENSVYLLGDKDSAGQYFWDAQIAVLTSRYEACPLAVIEAMAVGRPVVASDVGGTGHLIKHNKTGYLYTRGDENKAADYIVRLLKNHVFREEIGIRAREYYEHHFTPDVMTNKYVNLFGLGCGETINE